MQLGPYPVGLSLDRSLASACMVAHPQVGPFGAQHGSLVLCWEATSGRADEVEEAPVVWTPEDA